MKRYSIVFVILYLTQPVIFAQSKDVELSTLQKAMVGHYDTREQAATDSAFFEIALHMAPIWPERGYWLYVEQAMYDKQNKPYRQRVYELKKDEKGGLVSVIYTLPVDSVWIGQWKNPAAFDVLSPADLTEKKGCSVFLKKTGEGNYSGSTKPGECLSPFRGATWTSSEVELFPGKLVSWDRGFDADKKQVWGAEKGGYIFLKIAN